MRQYDQRGHGHPAHQWWLTVAQQQLQHLSGGAGRPDLRIGDAERNAVAESLQQHYAEGRLDQAELEERLDRALAAKTERDLAEIVHDLPGTPPWRPGPDHRHAHPQRRRHRPVFLWVALLVCLLVVIPPVVSGAVALAFALLRVAFLVLAIALLFRFLRHRRARRHDRYGRF